MSMNRLTSLSIIIPTYNEADIIHETIREVEKHIPEHVACEIIIADDGMDHMAESLKVYRKARPNTSVVHMKNQKRAGKGLSIAKAIAISKGNYVGFIDADMSVHPSNIDLALSKLSDSHVVIAQRVGNRFFHDESIVVTLIGHGFHFLNKVLFPRHLKNVHDTQCGFKFFRSDVAKQLYEDVVATDGMTDLEVIIKAMSLGCDIHTINVPRIKNREGKRNIRKIFLGELISYCRIVRRYLFTSR